MGLDKQLWQDLKEEATKVKDKSVNILKNAAEDIKNRPPWSELSRIKASVSMDDLTLDISKLEVRTHSQDNANTAIDWLAKMINKLVRSVEDNRTALRDVFMLLKEFAENISRQNVEIDKLNDLKTKVESLEEEMKTKDEKIENVFHDNDELRQRGLKGNIIVSSARIPAKGSRPEKLAFCKTVLQRDPQVLESDLDFCARMIREKTNIVIKKEEVSACHALPRKEPNSAQSYIICFGTRREGSSWDFVSTAMMTGRSREGGDVHNNKNIFLSFQLTKMRAQLSKAVREARWRGQVDRESINPNGEIKVRLAGSGSWTKVKGLHHLMSVLPPARR